MKKHLQNDFCEVDSAAPRRGMGQLFLALIFGLLANDSTLAAEKITYQEHVRPIFAEHCFACHSQDEKRSDLALDQLSAALAGGVGGEVLTAGDASGSRLWHLITHEESPSMPPGGDKLPDDQLALIEKWINGGLLDNKNSKVRKQAAVVQQATVSTDNRPAGEPAMPVGVLQQPVITPAKPAAVDAAAASPWAPLVAIGGIRQVSLYHTQSHELLGVLPFPEGSPRVIRFSRDGSLLIVGGGHAAASGKVAVFEVTSGRRLATIGEEIDEVLAADISPNHQLLALGGPKRTVRVYRLADGQLDYQIKKHTDWITTLRFSPNGKFLASGDRNGGLNVWVANRGLEVAQLSGHKEAINDLAWRFDSAVIASVSEDDSLRLWQTNGKQIKNWNPHGGGPRAAPLSVDFSRDGRLATTGRDGKVHLWQADGKHIKECQRLEEMGLVVRYTHEGKSVLAGDFLGNTHLLDAESGKSLARLAPNPPALKQRLLEARAATDEQQHLVSKLRTDDQHQQALLAEARSAREKLLQQVTQTDQQVSQLSDQRVKLAQDVSTATEQWRLATESLAKATKGRLEAERLLADASVSNEASTQEEATSDKANRQREAEQRLATATEAETQGGAALQEAEQQKATVGEQQQKVAGQVDSTLAKLKQLQEQKKKLPPLQPLQQSATQSTAKLAQAAQQLQASQQRLEKIQAAKQQFEQAATRLTEAQQQTDKQLAQLTTQATAAKQASQESGAALAKLKAQAEALAAQLAKTKAARQQAQTTLQEHQQQAQEAEAALQETQQESELLQAERAALEAAAEIRKQYAEGE
ncbi:WD40 domain-containing protein [Adhaeretor mobilis]|uniref:WD domain, G-beta repeat n=1 Tax=Adhaeretor mobilis TaxID=1930276 RepID=A0A517MZJ0_9BACT|nr:c-type cytochrome domain-containing protein [Adhaeretor mobilis]QDT00301.1 WD domain, G-beta repeat [Adhaeretor mobilis]